MDPRFLILDTEHQQKLKTLRAHAEANPFSIPTLLDMLNNKVRMGDDPNFKCFIPVGYCVLFSIEEQHPTIRHLSMSVADPGFLPAFETVSAVMFFLGFKRRLTGCTIKLLPIDSTRTSVEIYEPFNL